MFNLFNVLLVCVVLFVAVHDVKNALEEKTLVREAVHIAETLGEIRNALEEIA